MLVGLGWHGAKVRFHFANPLLQAPLDLCHGLALAQVAGLVEVLEVGAQFLQQFLGKSLSHR